MLVTTVTTQGPKQRHVTGRARSGSMKLLLERWNNFLNEQAYSIPHSSVVNSVDRALQILGLSSNTNLRLFLIEIAVMESGGSPKGVSKITHHVANPFQITDGALQVTKDTWKLKTMRDRIFKNAKMSNPWSEQNSGEVKGNVTMGALTAAMWILHKTNPNKSALDSVIPGTVEERATLWKTIYNTQADPHGTAEIYVRKNSL